jgi:RNA polymerase sigma-70 factor, ECF subfamily
VGERFSPTHQAVIVLKSQHLATTSEDAFLPQERISFERLYDEQLDFVWRSARRLGVDDGSLDDVVQQVFLVVHRRLGEFEGRSSTKTWLFSILLFAVREHRRSLRRKSPHRDGSATDPDTLVDTRVANNPERALERAEASRMIDELLETLDDDKRVVFVMAELEQMSAAEIAQATGLEPKAVYSRLRAARTDFERAASQMRRRAVTGTGAGSGRTS